MKIRPACADDLPQLLRFDSHISSPRLTECIRDHQVYAITDGTQITGVLRYSLFWQTIPFLDLLYLDEDCRHQGYGRQMMAYWESAMVQLGYRHVMLSTQEDETAKFFYEKLGYRRIGAFLPPEQEAQELMYLKSLTVPF